MKNIENKKGILFLTYHSVTDDFRQCSYNIDPDSFIGHIDFLRRNFSIIGIEEANEQLKSGIKDVGQVVVTFDDGYSSIYDFVFPVLKRLEVPFTLFVATDLISSGYKSYCSWPEICEMSSHGLVTIGSHGVKHLDFGTIHVEDVKKEMMDSKNIITAQTKIAVKYVAYPFGNCNEDIAGFCSDIYDLAFVNQNEIFRGNYFRVPRVSINEKHNELVRFADLINRSLFISS